MRIKLVWEDYNAKNIQLSDIMVKKVQRIRARVLKTLMCAMATYTGHNSGNVAMVRQLLSHANYTNEEIQGYNDDSIWARVS